MVTRMCTILVTVGPYEGCQAPRGCHCKGLANIAPGSIAVLPGSSCIHLKKKPGPTEILRFASPSCGSPVSLLQLEAISHDRLPVQYVYTCIPMARSLKAIVI